MHSPSDWHKWAQMRAHAYSHTHIDLSLTGQFYLSSGGWVGWEKESCERVWIQWSSASLSRKTCKMTLKFMTETTPASSHPPSALYATRHLRWQRRDVRMPPFCLQLHLQLKDKWRSALKTTSKTCQKHSVFQPKTALRVLVIETPFYASHRAVTCPHKHSAGNLSSQFLHQYRGARDY